MVIIKKYFNTWYDVYVNNRIILHHIYKKDVEDLLKADINHEIILIN